MASGVSAFGGTGQCYRFWLGFSECRLHTPNPALCLLEQADYMECLHRNKLKRRIATKLMEAHRQEEVKAGGGGGGGHGHGGGH